MPDTSPPASLVTLTKSSSVTETYKSHALKTWPRWSSKTHGDGTGKFPFDYSDNHQERVYVVSGTATLTPQGVGGEAVSLSAGDAVVFHRGYKCDWVVGSDGMVKCYKDFDCDGEERAYQV